ncbi:MAG: hypothetical protein JXR68_09150 [Bacteroidales bacterium]|nr:hypothetical protein [Bacteroidales bacterium]
MIYNTGDKPGKGDYKCTHCRFMITLETDDDVLPPCEKCFKTEWEKV